MAITFEKLITATKASAEAIAAATKTGKFVLPIAELGIITEMLNENNPLSAYTGVTVSSLNSGSVDVKYDVYNDNWKVKGKPGSDVNGGDDVVIETDNFKWNKPQTKEERMTAFDLKKGTPAVLGSRMAVSGKKFLQASIKEGFKELVAKNIADSSVTEIEAIDITSLDKIREWKITFLNAVTNFVVINEISREEVTITVAPMLFDALAEQGLIGDRATATFAGGQYSVGSLGGYRIQSGEIYLPALAGTKELFAVVGTTKSALHAVDYIAANGGELGISNDQATYLEICDIFGALDYKGKFGKVQSMIITAKTAPAPGTKAPEAKVAEAPKK